MERLIEVEVLSIALVILHEVAKQERDPEDEDARVPWRSLEALANSFRKGGVDIPAFGEQAQVESDEAQYRSWDADHGA